MAAGVIVAWVGGGWTATSSGLQYLFWVTLARGGGASVLAAGKSPGGVAAGVVGVALARLAPPTMPLCLAGLALAPLAVGCWVGLVAGEWFSVACELAGLCVGERQELGALAAVGVG